MIDASFAAFLESQTVGVDPMAAAHRRTAIIHQLAINVSTSVFVEIIKSLAEHVPLTEHHLGQIADFSKNAAHKFLEAYGIDLRGSQEPEVSGQAQ